MPMRVITKLTEQGALDSDDLAVAEASLEAIAYLLYQAQIQGLVRFPSGMIGISDLRDKLDNCALRAYESFMLSSQKFHAARQQTTEEKE